MSWWIMLTGGSLGFWRCLKKGVINWGQAIRDRRQKRLRKEQGRVRVTTGNGRSIVEDQEVYYGENGVEEFYKSSE